MTKYVNKTQNYIRAYELLEDIPCGECRYWRGDKKGCSRAVCFCEYERATSSVRNKQGRRSKKCRE